MPGARYLNKLSVPLKNDARCSTRCHRVHEASRPGALFIRMPRRAARGARPHPVQEQCRWPGVQKPVSAIVLERTRNEACQAIHALSGPYSHWRPAGRARAAPHGDDRLVRRELRYRPMDHDTIGDAGSAQRRPVDLFPRRHPRERLRGPMVRRL